MNIASFTLNKEVSLFNLVRRPQIWGVLVLFSLFLTCRSEAAPPRYNDIMPVSEIRAGMKGYGLTVFHGTKIDRFQVVVIGVVKKGSLIVPGHDMILVRMTGGPMTTRQANLIKGMSGSPVYIDGKIIGAFSQGEPASREPLGGVTPIEDMLEAWDPHLPTKPMASLPSTGIHELNLDQPIIAGARKITRIVYNVPQNVHMTSHGHTLVMHPCTSFMTFTGLSSDAYKKLSQLLAPYNVELVKGVVGGASKPGFKGAALVPGASFSMMLATGDLFAGATGTVTYRRGNRILGFGHPFLDIGPIDAAICSSYIYDVYPLLIGSYKIASPGPVVGRSDQDRNFAVSATMGQMPNMIPVTMDIHDLSTDRRRTFHVQVVRHPALWAGLVSSVAESAISEVRSMPGPVMAKVHTELDADELGTISRDNLVYDSTSIDSAATSDLDDMLDILTGNPFYPISIKSAKITVDMETGRKTATIQRIFVNEGKFQPGETAVVGVDLKPYKEPQVTRYLKIHIPATTPTGRYMLMVKGGEMPAAISFGGIILRTQPSQAPSQAPPTSIRQMVNRFNERPKNNEIAASLMLPTTSVDVDGERLTNLPPTLDTTMRSTRNSGIHLDRDEVKVTDPTEWVVSGQQALMINVEKKVLLENAAPSTGGSSSGSGSVSMQSSGMMYSDQDISDSGDSGMSADMSVKTNEFKTGAVKPSKTVTVKPAKEKPSTSPDEADTSSSDTSSVADTSATGEKVKPVGRIPSIWRQTSRKDFSQGTFQGTSVAVLGSLTLTRDLRKLQSTTESYIWSLISDGAGGFYAGTGTQGKILHWIPGKQVTVAAALPEIFVQALLLTHDGTLYAATGPHGRLYRVSPDGKYQVVFQAPEKYLLSLAMDSKNNLYFGSGGGIGDIYRMTPDGKTALFYHTTEEHVLSLTTDKNDILYAGTAEDGVVYRITPEGKGSVLYDAPKQSVTSLLANDKGDVYAACGPKGALYRISHDGTAKTVFERPSGLTALISGPGNMIYTAGGSSIFEVTPDDKVTSFDNPVDVDFLSLAMSNDGTIYAGTGNEGDLYSASKPSENVNGSYTSVVHDAGQIARWGMIRWDSAEPADSSLKIQTRTGNVADPDSTWSTWMEPRVVTDGGEIVNSPARFIQYRVLLSTKDSKNLPSLRDISISYLPRNQAPQITLQTPAGGERWAGKQSLKWEVKDIEKDKLTYDVFYSSDFGASWKPLPQGKIVTTKTITPTPASNKGTGDVSSVSASSDTQMQMPTLDEVKAELDKHPDMPAGLRDAVLKRAQELLSNNSGAKPDVTATANVTPAPSTHETTRSLDTTLLPDGKYQFKVTASDIISNPLDPQSGQVISDPVVICNAKPVVYILKAAMRVNADHTVHMEGVAVQTMIAINAVQYRVDNGEWMAAEPVDGLFDGSTESFRINTSALTAGKHTIEVQAFNTTGSFASDKESVEVK
jgi:sugar lactone lactonase YvrE